MSECWGTYDSSQFSRNVWVSVAKAKNLWFFLAIIAAESVPIPPPFLNQWGNIFAENQSHLSKYIFFMILLFSSKKQPWTWKLANTEHFNCLYHKNHFGKYLKKSRNHFAEALLGLVNASVKERLNFPTLDLDKIWVSTWGTFGVLSCSGILWLGEFSTLAPRLVLLIPGSALQITCMMISSKRMKKL